jgi:biopolymer transport protein ExbD
MSRRHRFGSGGTHPAEIDFELNLAPIIDCLVVLITFTLISASFLSVAVFDYGAAPNSASQSSTTPPVSIAE